MCKFEAILNWSNLLEKLIKYSMLLVFTTQKKIYVFLRKFAVWKIKTTS